MSIKVHILTAGGSLAAVEHEIRDVAAHALPQITARLPVTDVDIVFWTCPAATIPHLGIGARTADAT